MPAACARSYKATAALVAAPCYLKLDMPQPELKQASPEGTGGVGPAGAAARALRRRDSGGGARPAAHLPAAKVDHLHGTACVMRPEVQELLGTHVSGAGSRALSGSTEQPSLQLRASVDHLAGAAPCRLHTAQAQRELH